MTLCIYFENKGTSPANASHFKGMKWKHIPVRCTTRHLLSCLHGWPLPCFPRLKRKPGLTIKSSSWISLRQWRLHHRSFPGMKPSFYSPRYIDLCFCLWKPQSAQRKLRSSVLATHLATMDSSNYFICTLGEAALFGKRDIFDEPGEHKSSPKNLSCI